MSLAVSVFPFFKNFRVRVLNKLESPKGTKKWDEGSNLDKIPF